jgi:putative addiction module component (TIGR02574 family)
VTKHARKLLEEAMELSPSDRAELAADLLASLDGEPDDDAEAAWAAELTRRAHDSVAHPDDDVSWAEVRAEL